MITIDFEKRNNLTLTEFLYESIRSQILDTTLTENEKLPSKRTLALHLGVSVITVQNAYARLIDEGYLYSIEKKGFFVSDIARHFAPVTPRSRPRPNVQPLAHSLSSSLPRSYADRHKTRPQDLADFTSGAANLEKFPFSLWAKTMRQVLNTTSEALLERAEVSGVPELRRAIAGHLKAFRNMEVNENQIIIGAGTESLYSMLVQFLGRKEIFAVENPGYHKAGEIFKLNGAKCIPVKIDDEGLTIGALEKSGASVAHVCPSHHFPTGVVMNFKRRTELLEWAYRRKGRYIIEDDYDSEFRFNGKPLPTLQSIDRLGRVIYVNTFSKTLSPSIRIGYMVLPENLAEEFLQKLNPYSCQVSSFEQFTLARFIEDKNYEKHINRMKNYYRSLRNNLIKAFENSGLTKIGTIHEENSGLHFLFTLDKKQNAKVIQKKWRDAGIKIELLSDYFYSVKSAHSVPTQESFIINYSALDRNSISKAVKKMCEQIKN
ncbi:MAG: PLP-dependent aminotransferase family protein [Treponema sp.]|uniref:MocR-like pyridoxine biosynthesis transcription factor PdxR n=1 Tax=Treponema sp. TaxID=166 RepID=UPI00298E1BAB|nr:PLP-dependent aminotransferase family protein [Treponema sp.]MCR5386841.1 PLP-dependent aminotransferase family protein [Treponema sp.]